MITRTYGDVQVGDFVRAEGVMPVAHEVTRAEMTPDGYVFLEVGVGALIERLPPAWRRTPIDLERP